jgi:hypothetical protein
MIAPIVLALAIAPPQGLTASPKPDDDGTHIVIAFHGSAARHEVWRVAGPAGASRPPDPAWTLVKMLDAAPGDVTLEDQVAFGRAHAYAVRAAGAGEASDWVVSGPVAPAVRWFDTSRWFLFATVLGMAVLLYLFTRRARRGKLPYIRRIAGIDAMEEAVGRATEMGRPVFYVPGIEEVQDIQTVAGLLILGHIAELCARYDAKLRVACCIPLTMVLAEEIVGEGFLRAGRPEAHRPEDVQFLSSEQFAFTAAAVGIILREKPATNIYLGRFYGESLVLAEAGYVNQAIQIGGTAELTQLPFFIAACDYTLIGEELFAVSAYLSREPGQLATLKSVDTFKVVILAILIVGTILATGGWANVAHWIAP